MLAFARPKGGNQGDKNAVDAITCFGAISEPWQQGIRSRENPFSLGRFQPNQ